ncbi:MAG: hypothetical protein ACFFD4_12150 [Candidatus Odinarchaeota archaeon]
MTINWNNGVLSFNLSAIFRGFDPKTATSGVSSHKVIDSPNLLRMKYQPVRQELFKLASDGSFFSIKWPLSLFTFLPTIGSWRRNTSGVCRYFIRFCDQSLTLLGFEWKKRQSCLFVVFKDLKVLVTS